MRFRLIKRALVYSGFLALSACVALPTTVAAPIPSPPPVAAPVALSGTALQLQNAGAPYSPTPVGSTAMASLSGSFTESSNETAIFDGTYLLVDPSGFDINGVLTDGTVYAVALDGAESGLFTRTYNYVVPIAYSYSDGVNSTSVLGNVGVALTAADIPVAGTAQYVGDAFARVESANGTTGFLLSGGISIVDVNFAAGTVDVTMGLFTAVDQYAPNTVTPVDTISGTGMAIVGASFTGGTWATYKDGALVNFTGPATTVSAGGDFYGYDPLIAAPDEVGGVILMDGNSGLVYGIFTAD